MERRPGGHHNASENRRDAKMQSKKEPAMMRCWAESDVSKVRRSRKMTKLSGSGALSLRSTMDPERPYADTSSECRDVLNASKCAFREMNRKDLIQVVAVRS